MAIIDDKYQKELNRALGECRLYVAGNHKGDGCGGASGCDSSGRGF